MAITDLTGTKWYVPSGWIAEPGYGLFAIDGTINGEQLLIKYGSSIGIGYDNDGAFYGTSPEFSYHVVPGHSGITIGWLQNTEPITINITGGSDTNNTKLISWLETYGELQGSEEEETITIITYNGTTTELTEGQTATLECENKKMKSNVVVNFGLDGSIGYNGAVTSVAKGQTATMECAGKKMRRNVRIFVNKVGKGTFYLDYRYGTIRMLDFTIGQTWYEFCGNKNYPTESNPFYCTRDGSTVYVASDKNGNYVGGGRAILSVKASDLIIDGTVYLMDDSPGGSN